MWSPIPPLVQEGLGHRVSCKKRGLRQTGGDKACATAALPRPVGFPSTTISSSCFALIFSTCTKETPRPSASLKATGQNLVLHHLPTFSNLLCTTLLTLH